MKRLNSDNFVATSGYDKQLFYQIGIVMMSIDALQKAAQGGDGEYSRLLVKSGRLSPT